MRDLWNLFRTTGPQSQALHFSYEKSGLTVDNQPIPWNADAVLVEANIRLSASVGRQKSDFRLRVGGPAGETVEPEVLRQEPGEAQARLFFRLSVPARSTTAELTWRDRTLGQLALPVIGLDEFVRQISVQMPTAHVCMGAQTVACQTFVSGQCQGLSMTALLASPVGLMPLADMDLRVEIRREDGNLAIQAPVRLSSSQLRSRQALVGVIPPRPRRAGTWLTQWFLDDLMLAMLKVRAITKRQFLRSLRVSATRFAVQTVTGELQVLRNLPPLETLQRVGPCFLIGSGEPGMAGMASLRVFAKVDGGAPPMLMHDDEVLIADGPMPLFAGTLDMATLAHVKHFYVEGPTGIIGILPLAPVPTAAFTTEGGFRPVEDFAWSPAAEEQLNERLDRLFGGS